MSEFEKTSNFSINTLYSFHPPKKRYTYEVAPVFTLLEREVVERSLELVGYPAMPEADGILSPGGSISNMYGMVLARYRYFPESKRTGMTACPPLAYFTSEDGHYSISKGAHWLGLGTDNVFKVFIWCTSKRTIFN